jgi:antitoxin component YwqK of YwqJK toxin-antitoxin module
LLKTEANRDIAIVLNFTYCITNLEESPRSEGKLVSNEKEGKWIFYTDSSKNRVKESSEWKQNKRHGKTESYFPNGKISRIETYKQGILHGESYTYGTPSGKLYTTQIFNNGDLVKEINH